MKFNLKTPCKDCPFRNDITPYLNKGRVKEILIALTEQDKTFSCHKTVNYDDIDLDVEYNKTIEHKPDENESHCAGALILLVKTQTIYTNVLFRLAVMSKMLDLNKLDLKAPIFNSFKEFIEVQDD